MSARPKYVPNRRPGDDHIFNELGRGDYEKYCRLKPGMRVVDAGAHAGFFTTYAAEKVGPTGHVFAFEPEPDNFHLLCENVKDFDNVTVYNKALWFEKDTLLLNLSHSSAEHSLVNKQPGAPAVSVQAVRMDSVVERIDFVKIDVEGVELQVLQGATALFHEKSPLVTMEIGEKERKDVHKFLEDLGYTVYIHEYFLSGVPREGT